MVESSAPPARSFESFAAHGALARIDRIEQTPGGRCAIVALAPVLRPSDALLDRLAFWLAVARRAGLDVARVAVLHLDPDFVRGAEPPDERLLKRTDLTRAVEFLARDVPARLESQREVLAREHEPPIEPSPHCRRPEPCPFLARCTGAKPDDWIGFLPGLRQPEFDALHEAGVARAVEIPETSALTPAQSNARAACLHGGAHAAPDLARRLEGFGPPADALDFEAIIPEVPLYPGTRPLEVVPFQWSAHLACAGGGVEAAGFLAEPPADPRRAFAESLIAAFGPRSLPIAVYSDFESEALAALGCTFPDLAPELERVRARLCDLLFVVRRSVYHPAFRGAFGLKRVAPVLAPGFGWDDLGEITDGGAASRAWLEMALGEADAERAARLHAGLGAYCARDSLALVKLLAALRALAEKGV